MKKRFKTMALITAVLLLFSMLAGCEVFTEEVEDVTILSAAFDPDFEENGEITVKLVPVDVDGDLGRITRITATAEYDDDEGEPQEKNLNVSFPESVKSSNSNDPWAIAIDIDSSGSMDTNDPYDLRIDASELFVENILAADEDSVFNIYDFGYSYSEGFEETRQLTADWTSDYTEISAAIEDVEDSGGTPMYESISEVLQVFDDEIDDDDYLRAMLVLSDGIAGDETDYKEDVLKYSLDYSIPINTIALGRGAYEEKLSSLSDETGGIYANAAEADELVDVFDAMSVGTKDGYFVYTLKFWNPDDLPDGADTDVTITLSITARNYDELKVLDLNS